MCAPMHPSGMNQVGDSALVDDFIKALNGQCENPIAAEVTINSDGVVG